MRRRSFSAATFLLGFFFRSVSGQKQRCVSVRYDDVGEFSVPCLQIFYVFQIFHDHRDFFLRFIGEIDFVFYRNVALFVLQGLFPNRETERTRYFDRFGLESIRLRLRGK